MSSIILVFFHKFFKIFLYSIFCPPLLPAAHPASFRSRRSAFPAAGAKTSLARSAKRLPPEQEAFVIYCAAGSAPPLSRIR